MPFYLFIGRSNSVLGTEHLLKYQLQFKNYPLIWSPTIASIGDVASFIIQLGTTLEGYECNKQWICTLKERELQVENDNRNKSDEVPEKHLNPVKVLMTLEEVLNEDTILIGDGGDFVATAAYILRPRSPLSWLDPGAFGTLGVGAGFALGAKLCRPDYDVVVIYGDGACGYSIVEFDTFTRHKIPILAVIGNDASWMQMARDQVPRFGTAVACVLKHSDYHEISVAFGGRGFLLCQSENTDEKIRKTFNAAIQELRNGNSVIVNALIGTTDFRQGSISI